MLQLFDKIKATALERKEMPLKGRVKIIFVDPRDGTEKVVAEDHNLVTDAISSIFAANWLNAVDFYNLLPTWHMFGGIMCFSQAMTADVSTMWPDNQNVNSMTANAGQTPHSSASPTRGNPNGAATEISGDHIRLAWDWSINQGNGTIACCCLTHSNAGDIGLMPDGTAPLWLNTTPGTPNFNRFAGNYMHDNVYSRERALTLPVAVNSSGNGIALYFTGTALEEITTAHSYVTANLLEPAIVLPDSNYREISTRTATLSRTFAVGYAQIAQDSDNYYVIERDSGNNKKLYVDVIDKSDFSVTGKTITITDDSITLARPSIPHYQMYSGIVSNGSVYLVSGADAKTFVRVNINNAADVEELTTNLTSNIVFTQSAFNISDNFVLGRNFLINGDTVYPVAARSARTSGNSEKVGIDILARYGAGPSVYEGGNTNSNDGLDNSVSGGIIALPYLATVANVTEVTKTASKAMRIEYELTEA